MSIEQRRADLIAATIEVIAESGCDGATTRTIAKRAGAPLAALHYSFSTKEDLFFSTFHSLVFDQIRAILHVRPNSGLGRASGHAIRQFLVWVTQNKSAARAQLELSLWIARHDSAAGQESYQSAIDLLTSILAPAMRSDDNPELLEPLAKIIIIAADGVVVHDAIVGDNLAIGVASDSLAESVELFVEANRLRR
ncbi:TetR/AcrR family transcriptional regulator [Rhodococcus wratislaviensis]|uniref:TetR/AcrR family transcriptional regulator n=1 Tax=Rhodococcus wratislaviensis TaxID=44752 RepID=UPI003657048F